MTRALYSLAELRTSSLSGVGSSSSSASTQRAVPGPETPAPILTRCSALITAAGSPVASRPICTMEASTAYDGVAVLETGGDEQAPVAVGAGRIHRGAGGVVELDRHHHAGQDDEIGQEKYGQSGCRHSVEPPNRVAQSR